jgi:hypothetical protein
MSAPVHVETPSEDWGPFGIPGPDDLIAEEPAEPEPHVVTSEAPYSPLLVRAQVSDAEPVAAQPHIVPPSEAPYSPLLVKPFRDE